MKGIILKTLIFAAILIISTGNSMCQTKGYFGAVNGGVSFLTGNLAEYWETGFNVGGRGGYVFGDKYGFSLGFDYNYYSLEGDSHYGDSSDNKMDFHEDQNSYKVSNGGGLNIFSIKGEFLFGDFRSTSKIVPYGLIGLGVDILDVGDVTISGDSTVSGTYGNTRSETDFGLDIGAGIGYKISKNLSITAESKYCIIAEGSSTDAFIPLKLGVMYTP